MARRRIGQESLAFTAREPGRNAALDELAAAIDGAPLAKVLDGIGAAARGEAEAGWSTSKKGRPVRGYKAQVAADGDGGIVRAVDVTPANVHDAAGMDGLLTWHPGDVDADAAHDSGGGIRAPRRRRTRRRARGTHG